MGRAGRSRAWSLSRRKDIVERQDFPPSRPEKFDDVNWQSQVDAKRHRKEAEESVHAHTPLLTYLIA